MFLVPDDAKGVNGFPLKVSQGNSYPKSLRIRQNSQYQEFFKSARSVDGRFFRLYASEKTGVMAKVGIIASKKAIGDAVHRNRCKRLLRELVRTSDAIKSGSFDLVFVAKRTLKDTDFHTLSATLPSVLKRLMP